MDLQNYWALIVLAIIAIFIIELGTVIAVYSILKGVKEIKKAHAPKEITPTTEPCHVTTKQ